MRADPRIYQDENSQPTDWVWAQVSVVGVSGGRADFFIS